MIEIKSHFWKSERKLWWNQPQDHLIKLGRIFQFVGIIHKITTKQLYEKILNSPLNIFIKLKHKSSWISLTLTQWLSLRGSTFASAKISQHQCEEFAAFKLNIINESYQNIVKLLSDEHRIPLLIRPNQVVVKLTPVSYILSFK